MTDIEPFLGSHRYRDFLNNDPHSVEVAHLYEYKYSTHGDPANKSQSRMLRNIFADDFRQDFITELPMFDSIQSIPASFPVKRQYPLPSPAPPPPMNVDYARPIPAEVNERIAARQVQNAPVVPPVAQTSTASSLVDRSVRTTPQLSTPNLTKPSARVQEKMKESAFGSKEIVRFLLDVEATLCQHCLSSRRLRHITHQKPFLPYERLQIFRSFRSCVIFLRKNRDPYEEGTLFCYYVAKWI